MSPLGIRLFGKFCIQRNERTVNGLEACKLQELFSYLLIFRNSPHPRESLAALLWGDSSTAQSRKYLRQALWQLQSALDSQEETNHESILQVESDWVSLNPQVELWLDIAIFERAFSLARDVTGRNLEPALAQSLAAAVQLYQGDLLEGWYQDWCLCERERLQSKYLIMLDKLMGYCEANQEYEAGLAYGQQVMRYERARESTHRRLMRLHFLAGDRTAALRQYTRCAAALAEELSVKPAKRTVMLYEQIRADEFEIGLTPPSRPGATNNAAAAAAAVPLAEMLEQLRQLRKTIAHIQQEVQQGIQAVEMVLKGRR
jgi:DNA-binding SARP family transcriptional activator